MLELHNMRDKFHSSSEQETPHPFGRKELDKRVLEAEAESRGTGELLRELLQEKERFTSVFQTEKGSYYFVLNDGSCLRIQELDPDIRDEDDGRWRARPIADHILFIDPSSVENLKHLIEFPGFVLNKDESLSSRTVLLSGLRLGSVPFEYGFVSVGDTKPIFNISGVTAIYIGSEQHGHMIPLSSRSHLGDYPMGVTHIGHAISRVVWPE